MACTLVLYCFRHLSKLLTSIALGLGLYFDWTQTDNTDFVIIALAVLSFIGVCLALKFYYQLEQAFQVIIYLWYGFLQGVVMFTMGNARDTSPVVFDMMKAFFLLALIAEVLWIFTERWLRLSKHELSLFDITNFIESVGFCAGSFATKDLNNLMSIFLILLSFNVTIINIKMKSLRDAILFIILSLIWVNKSNLEASIYLNFIGKSLGPVIIDIYLSPFSVVERWQMYLFRHKIVRYIIVLLTLFVGLATVITTAIVCTYHVRWYAVIIIFSFVAILWLCFHLIYLITYWKFIGKVTTSVEHCRELSIASTTSNSLSLTMASHGLRHFSVICHMITSVTVATTIVIFVMSSAIQFRPSFEVCLLAFTLECFSLNLFGDMSSVLGGTCVAYSLFSPAYRLAPGVHFIPPTLLQDATSRATKVLNLVQRFVTFHALSNHGYEFTTAGLTADNVRGKVTTFFRERTEAGVRYDTYLLYYSGDVLETGDWALSDGACVTAKDLIGWWNDTTDQSQSRLILILDTTYSHLWGSTIKSTKSAFVAIQTCQINNPNDVEKTPEIGEFTQDYVNDSLQDISIDWSKEDRAISAVYIVSKDWFKFRLHEPTFLEIKKYWEENFPRFTHGIVVLFSFNLRANFCCVCKFLTDLYEACCFGLIKLKRLDTGHGFMLVKS